MERVPFGTCSRFPSWGCQQALLSGWRLSCRMAAHFKWIVVVQRRDRRLPPFTCIEAPGIWLSQSGAPGADRVKERQRSRAPCSGVPTSAAPSSCLGGCPEAECCVVLASETVVLVTAQLLVCPQWNSIRFFFSDIASAFPPWHPWANHVLAGPDM